MRWPDQARGRHGPAGPNSEERGIATALVAARTPHGVDLGVGDPRRELDEHDAGIVDVVVRPLRRNRRDHGPADLYETGEVQIVQLQSDVLHASTADGDVEKSIRMASGDSRNSWAGRSEVGAA